MSEITLLCAQLREEGVTYRAIADRAGCSIATVQRYLAGERGAQVDPRKVKSLRRMLSEKRG